MVNFDDKIGSRNIVSHLKCGLLRRLSTVVSYELFQSVRDDSKQTKSKYRRMHCQYHAVHERYIEMLQLYQSLHRTRLLMLRNQADFTTNPVTLY